MEMNVSGGASNCSPSTCPKTTEEQMENPQKGVFSMSPYVSSATVLIRKKPFENSPHYKSYKQPAKYIVNFVNFFVYKVYVEYASIILHMLHITTRDDVFNLMTMMLRFLQVKRGDGNVPAFK